MSNAHNTYHMSSKTCYTLEEFKAKLAKINTRKWSEFLWIWREIPRLHTISAQFDHLDITYPRQCIFTMTHHWHRTPLTRSCKRIHQLWSTSWKTHSIGMWLEMTLNHNWSALNANVSNKSNSISGLLFLQNTYEMEFDRGEKFQPRCYWRSQVIKQ